MKTIISPEDFTRINNDVNGNPRCVCHFLKFVKDSDNWNNTSDLYIDMIKRANKIGGRKYHTKSYGGGVVFQSYNIQNLCDTINELTK